MSVFGALAVGDEVEQFGVWIQSRPAPSPFPGVRPKSKVPQLPSSSVSKRASISTFTIHVRAKGNRARSCQRMALLLASTSDGAVQGFAGICSNGGGTRCQP